jgi:hypothetical protein
MLEPDHIETELKTIGRGLFMGVECDVWRDRVVVYARLGATPNLEHALKESERLLCSVLGRLGTQDWIAAVHWSERMCRTIAPADLRLVGPPSGRDSREP